MPSSSDSLLLTRLAWPQVRDHLEIDSRLIVPIDACDQYGTHMPIGASGLVVESFAKQLSEEFGVLRAPVLPFGVNLPSHSVYPGSAGVREKTLHAFLNDLLGSWEDSGFTEFILLTVHGHDAQVEAAATVTAVVSRVRVIEALNLDLSPLLDGPNIPQHGGEVLTSLMLHLYPELVRMELAMDLPPPERATSTLRRLSSVPAGTQGSIGYPTLATAEKGRLLYEYIYGKIRKRVFTEAD
jgi:creatinine amidohydrolase